MSGDLLFWTGDGSPAGHIISWATKGPFIHVSVDLGDDTDLGAHSDGGVRVRTLPPNRRGITTYPLPLEARILRRP